MSKVDMSLIPGYEGPAHPLSSPIEALTGALRTSIIGQPGLGVMKMHSTLRALSLVVVISLKNLLLPEFGRFLMVGPQMKS
jgi:hypothetical protein